MDWCHERSPEERPAPEGTGSPGEPKGPEASERTLAELFAGLTATSGRAGRSALNRLSPREREVDHGWLDDAGGEPVDRWVERLEDTQVLAALRELQPDQRDVLLLRMLGGLTAPEVADVLGRTTGAVKALQHRGLADLSRMLGLRKPPGSGNRPISRAEDPRTAGRG